MASATTIYLTGKQRKGLFSRARKRKTSFSKEVRDALDLYLDLPPDFDEEKFASLAREANASLKRSIGRLDEAIGQVKMTVKKLGEIDRRLDELAERRL
jgi:hypothetical protein